MEAEFYLRTYSGLESKQSWGTFELRKNPKKNFGQPGLPNNYPEPAPLTTSKRRYGKLPLGANFLGVSNSLHTGGACTRGGRIVKHLGQTPGLRVSNLGEWPGGHVRLRANFPWYQISREWVPRGATGGEHLRQNPGMSGGLGLVARSDRVQRFAGRRVLTLVPTLAHWRRCMWAGKRCCFRCPPPGVIGRGQEAPCACVDFQKGMGRRFAPGTLIPIGEKGAVPNGYVRAL